jgi:diaminohydroxyphosphoribosylaminopyrimidine deaminase/5-amino-6-(5-phosphoribosylamino)uracil reductase
LSQAQQQAQGGTAYVTLEPCCHTGKTGPCSTALIEAGIKRVVVATLDPNPLVQTKGVHTLRQHGVQVDVGLLEHEAIRLNRGFMQRMRTQKPWVTVKSAATLDGRTALKNGQSKWITSQEARQDVQYLRAQHDAILTGIDTVLADDPALNVRLTSADLGIEGEVIQPTRVIMDTHLRLSKQAKVVTIPGKTLIYTQADMINDALNNTAACDIIPVGQADGHVSIHDVLNDLAVNKEINSVLVEAGSRLSGALFKHKCVDEFVFYMAPKLFGSDARGLLELGPISSIDEHIALDIQDVRSVGDDLRITALIK